MVLENISCWCGLVSVCMLAAKIFVNYFLLCVPYVGVAVSVSVSVTEMSTVRHYLYGLHVYQEIFLC
jgi:hypothetical protein